MSSFKLHRKRGLLGRTIALIAIVVLGCFVVWLIVRSIVVPVKQSLPLAAADAVYSSLLPKRTLVHKLIELQTTLESYDAQITTAKLLQEENEALKAELGRPGSVRGVLAHVQTLPNRSIYNTFTIDAGTAENVEIGQTVFAFGSIALGAVTDVGPHYATVQLFSASDKTTSGTIGTNNVSVTLIGRGGGEYEVRLPRDLQFTVGDVVAYQSVHSAVLAEIERIVTDPRDPFQRLIAKTPINLQALKWVIVK